ANLIATDDAATQTAFRIQICRVLEPWIDRTVAFNVTPAYDETDVIEYEYDASETEYNFDVTTQMQKMINAKNSSNGWLLKLADEDPLFFAAKSVVLRDPKVLLTLSMPTFACSDAALNWNQE